MKKILGLDIGTNSIGWAFIESNGYENPTFLNGKILKIGSRIIPMDADTLGKFESGVKVETKAANRRSARGARRLNHRYKLRRTRLIQALKILNWIPENFPLEFKKLKSHNINDFLPFSDELKKEANSYFQTDSDNNLTEKNYLISEDWIIYFLKYKALNEKITLNELSRILYHYNQRRGFKSSRKDNQSEEVVKTTKSQEKFIEIIDVISIKDLGRGEGKFSDFTIYELLCKSSHGEFKTIKYRKNPLDWVGKSIEVEITKETLKDKTVKYKIGEVDPMDWTFRKKALEKDLLAKNLPISQYYLQNLREGFISKSNPYTIKQRIVDRIFYQNEFKLIWENQKKYYEEEFQDKEKLEKIADAFYKHNLQKNKELKSRDLLHIFFNDIIYFQRGLKSQKGLLANCSYESKTYKNLENKTEYVGLKVTSKSSPLFQEFRIWQTIHNLKIRKNEELGNGRNNFDLDVTDQYLSKQKKEELFEFLDSKLEASGSDILKFLGFEPKKINNEILFDFSLNLPDDKIIYGNQTKALFRKVFKKHDFIIEGENYLNNLNLFTSLWHIIYSLPSENDIKNALNNKKYFDIPEDIISDLSRLPEFKSDYASYSSKALKKLLPLMRVGKFWDESQIDLKTKSRIQTILDGVVDDSISPQVREKILSFKPFDFHVISDFSGLPTFLAAYVVYNRHSERENEEKYQSPDDLNINTLLPNNSLRNPVVEKVIRETLKLVKDIWKNPELGRPDFIVVELGREMKNNIKDREAISKNQLNNKIEKERISKLLKELKIPNFNPDSHTDLEKFRLLKDSSGLVGEEMFETLFKRNNSEFIPQADIEKYRLWADQSFRSVYTGLPIPLSFLFTEKYQVDHIIPRAKFYDDSFANKVVVEAEVNALKGNSLAMMFIEDFQGKNISLTDGRKVQVLSLDDYKSFLDKNILNKKKKKYLQLYQVPEGFIERQLNDTKYISKTVSQFLLPVARGSEKDQGVIFTSGNITSDLKNKWGLNTLWKELLFPRFQRLEGILNEPLIFPKENKPGDYYFGKEYKRIDHRHHALDALVIACTTRSHIKYLNSLSSFSNDIKEIAKNNEWKKWKYLLSKKKQLENKEVGMTEFSLPWDNFYLETKEAMEGVMVSHKPSPKLISKAFNKYEKWVEVEPEKWEKKLVDQLPPQNEDKYWVTIKQSLFGQPLGKIFIADYKKNVSIENAIKNQINFESQEFKNWNSEELRIALTPIRRIVNSIIKKYEGDEKSIMEYFTKNPLRNPNGTIIRELDLLSFKKYASKRVNLDDTFDIKKIDSIPYSNLENSWLPQLLKEHLKDNQGKPEIAFRGEGLEVLAQKTPNKFPIKKVTTTEGGVKIEKNNKLLEGDKGVNQYFIIEIKKAIDKKTGEEVETRTYSTPNFLDCIERLAKNQPIHDNKPDVKYIVLSPGDVVYVPERGQKADKIDWTDRKRIVERAYIMKSSNTSTCYFLPVYVSSLIAKGEFESLGKSEKTKEGDQMIKNNFIKLKIDRLGNFLPI